MKSYEEIYQEVTTIITQKISDSRKIQPNSSLYELTTDSIQLFELVIAFERHYRMEASYDDIINIATVADIARLIHTKLAPVPIKP